MCFPTWEMNFAFVDAGFVKQNGQVSLLIQLGAFSRPS